MCLYAFTLECSIPKYERSHIAHNHFYILIINYLIFVVTTFMNIVIIVSDLYTKTPMFHNYPKKGCLLWRIVLQAIDCVSTQLKQFKSIMF